MHKRSSMNTQLNVCFNTDVCTNRHKYTNKKQLLYAMSNIQMLIYDDTRRFQQIIQKHFADFHSGEFCSKSIEHDSDRRRIRTGSVVVHLFTQPPPMYQRSHVHVCSLDFCFAQIQNKSKTMRKLCTCFWEKIQLW